MKIREFKIFDKDGNFIENCESNDYITNYTDCIEVYFSDKTIMTRKNIYDIKISNKKIKLKEAFFDPVLFNICSKKKRVAKVKIFGDCQNQKDNMYKFELSLTGRMHIKNFNYNMEYGAPEYVIG